MARSDVPNAPAHLSNLTSNRWQRLRQVLKQVGLALGAGLLAWQTWRAIGQISASHTPLPGGWALLAALLLAMLSHLAQMAGWREVITGLGTRLSWRLVMEGYMLSMLPRYIPGTVWGYLSRGQWFYDRAAVSLFNSSISSVMEMGLILLSGIAFAGSMYFQSLWAGLAVMVASCLCYALVSQVIQRRSWASRLLVIPVSRFLKAFALYGLIWPLYGVVIAVLLVTVADLWRVLVDYSYAFFFAWTSGFLAFFIPSGLGVREYALQSALQGYGISSPILIMVPLLVRFATIISEILWLCVGLGLKRRK